MANADLKAAAQHMDKSIEALLREFNTVRTGKASPTLLDTVRVDAYGTHMPINQVANVSAPEPQLLVIQPYDPNNAGAVAKAIQTADLGLNPSVDGNLIRVSIPPLTEERRREMVKVLHRMAEEARIAIRHARQEARSALQRRQKDGELGEDEAHRRMTELQEITDRHIARVDDQLARKEAEVMEV